MKKIDTIYKVVKMLFFLGVLVIGFLYVQNGRYKVIKNGKYILDTWKGEVGHYGGEMFKQIKSKN
jgi:hypothetical protein